MLTYSFITPPLERIIQNIGRIYPGIKEAFTIYVNDQKELQFKHYILDEVSKHSIGNHSVSIQKFRRKKSNHSWHLESTLSFFNTKKRKGKKIKQLSFDHEEQTDLLCLKFLSPIDQLYDCLFLKIENTSVFGMSKQGSNLNVQEKNIVGQLLHQTINYRIKEETNNLQTHRLVLNNISLQQNNIKTLEEDNLTLRNNYKKSILFFIKNVLERMSDKFQMDVALSDKAKEYILEKDLDIKTLEKILVQGAHMAANLTLSYSKTILIREENIIVSQTKEDQPTLTSNDKHSHIIEILDKYEASAEKAFIKEWKINGNTVAELSEPKITPSAITFNLKKYKKQINLLLERYEDKWPLLRTHFKPLKNIMESPQRALAKYKSA